MGTVVGFLFVCIMLTLSHEAASDEEVDYYGDPLIMSARSETALPLHIGATTPDTNPKEAHQEKNDNPNYIGTKQHTRKCIDTPELPKDQFRGSIKQLYFMKGRNDDACNRHLGE